MFSVELFVILSVGCLLDHSTGYSALRDTQIIADFRHANIARELVHKANWASVGTISTVPAILSYPMVNIISIDDNEDDKSTGHIRFLLTDLDFTGPDWRATNKVTFSFSEEQTLACQKHSIDPMEPTCARAMISGAVKQMDPNDSKYQVAMNAFIKRHPAATNWIKTHTFYLCELEIHNIFVLDYYGGPHNVAIKQYYDIVLDE